MQSKLKPTIQPKRDYDYTVMIMMMIAVLKWNPFPCKNSTRYTQQDKTVKYYYHGANSQLKHRDHDGKEGEKNTRVLLHTK